MSFGGRGARNRSPWNDISAKIADPVDQAVKAKERIEDLNGYWENREAKRCVFEGKKREKDDEQDDGQK